MKLKILLIIVSMFILHETYSQATIDDCTKKTQRKDLKVRDVKYYQAQGLDLTVYKWDNSDVNCHVNLMILEGNKYKGNKANGWIYGGLAVFGLAYGASSDSDVSLIIGGASAGLSILSFVTAPKHRDKMYYHMQEVNDYYQMQGLK